MSSSGPAPAARPLAHRIGRSVDGSVGRSVAQRAAHVRFRRALALVAMTLVLPGSAQLVAGNRRIGRWVVWLSLVLISATVLTAATAYFWHEAALWIATTPTALQVLRLVLVVLGLLWAALFVDAFRLGEPLSLDLAQRRTTLALNLVLALSVATTLLFGAHEVNTQRGLIMTLFTGTAKSDAVGGRYNVLLIGADSGVTRWGLRTDSMTIASIDADTGRTVLIGLPRNMENFPFQPGSVLARQFPHGYDCSSCELNSLSTYASDHPTLFAGSKEPGVEATIDGVEGITGLKINYWAMINLQGFRDLSNAVGGVTIDVRQPIAIGKTGAVVGWIRPGVQKLSGDALLWYARSRATSDDYSRMARQKCVMSAMLQQLSPTDVLTHFDALASAGEGMLQTSIPPSEVDTFVNLAVKAKTQNVATLSLVPPLVNTADPDISTIRAAIAKALAGKSSGAKHVKRPDTMTEGSYGSLQTGYAANDTSDLAAAC